jgi:L-serine dehydratase
MGPVMVGPSSSHTAGAVKIGLVTRRLLGAQPLRAEILLHGSFAATGGGHGTDKAIVAGLLGMKPDDIRIPDSFALARRQGMAYTIGKIELRGAHPNSVVLRVEDKQQRRLEILAASVGGGRVKVMSIDGMDASFTCDYPTIIVRNEDRPGMISEVSTVLSQHNVNIAAMQLYRQRRGGLAVMLIESDQPVGADIIQTLRRCPASCTLHTWTWARKKPRTRSGRPWRRGRGESRGN